MEIYDAAQLAKWMDGALIACLEDLEAKEIILDGAHRLAAFDDGWKLKKLRLGGSCPVAEWKGQGLHLFLVNQQEQELHFALRELSTYRIQPEGDFIFGANCKTRIRAGNMLSLLPLLEKAREKGRLSLEDAYRVIQPHLEGLWRGEISLLREEKWTEEECLRALFQAQKTTDAETNRCFRRYGLICLREIALQGISEPRYMTK